MVGMRRRDFITLLGGATAWPLTAHAQAPKNIPRLCFLTFDPGTLQSNRFDAFFQGLRDLGYANGRNIVMLTTPPLVSPWDASFMGLDTLNSSTPSTSGT